MRTNEKNGPADLNTEDGFTLQQWAESPITPFNKFDLYMAEVDPLVSALQRACRDHGLPIAFIIAHTQHADGNTAVAKGMSVPQDVGSVPAEILMVDAVASGQAKEVFMLAMLEQKRLRAARDAAEPGVLEA